VKALGPDESIAVTVESQGDLETLLGSKEKTERKIVLMLWTLAVILLVMWLLGMVSSYTLGGFIHILLVIAIIVVLVRIIRGERPL
jgi:predicted nucleic acid-binding Zn ribbon protein